MLYFPKIKTWWLHSLVIKIEHMMKLGLFRISLVMMSLLSTHNVFASPLWHDANVNLQAKTSTAQRVVQGRHLTVNQDQLLGLLLLADKTSPSYLPLPMPDGKMVQFRVINSPVMEAKLAKKYPEIQTYKATAVNQAHLSGRIDIGPNGFHAYISDAQTGQTFLIDPTKQSQYVSYSQEQYQKQFSDLQKNYSCGFQAGKYSPISAFDFKNNDTLQQKLLAKSEGNLLNYRLAVATTFEYSTVISGAALSKAKVQAEVVTAINRVNQIYERDLGVHLNLVNDNDDLISLVEDDGYSNDSPSSLLEENQKNIDDIIGSGNYDIGHVFSTGGGGLAANALCIDKHKAKGETGLSNPISLKSDVFYIDFVAHEIGHQFGAAHSFNGTTGACSGSNRTGETAYEPGSGVTIMGYAGICRTATTSENIARHSLPIFHAGSIEEIRSFIKNPSHACATQGAPSGHAPSVNAGSNYTIPGCTPFELTGSADDADGDALTYTWDQMDVGKETDATTFGKDLGDNAILRSYGIVFATDQNKLSRALPKNGIESKAEVLPTTDRKLNFRLTVRDGNGGVNEDDVSITVDSIKGPFTVNQPNKAGLTLDSTKAQVIMWDVANTNFAPINCTKVKISYSIDNAKTFTTLKQSTNNDGNETVNFGAVTASKARIKVSCVNNIFFDLSDNDFALNNNAGEILELNNAVSTNLAGTCRTKAPTSSSSSGSGSGSSSSGSGSSSGNSSTSSSGGFISPFILLSLVGLFAIRWRYFGKT